MDLFDILYLIIAGLIIIYCIFKLIKQYLTNRRQRLQLEEQRNNITALEHSAPVTNLNV